MRHSTAFVIPLVVAAMLSAAIAVFAWRRRRVQGAIPLAVLALAAGTWSLGYAGELSSADLATSLIWAKAQYLGIGAVPVAWLALALQYTRHDQWLTRRTILLLALMPLATLLLAWTNEQHHLIWRTIGLSQGDTPSVLAITHGPWFWGYIGYSYLCLLAGAGLLTDALVRSRQRYRGQATALVVGIVAPWVGNALYVANLSPWPHLDLTPFGFTLAGLAVAWSLTHFRLLDLAPIAREIVIDSMSDGVLVLDEQQQVVDINRAARRMLGGTTADVIGRPARQVFARQTELLARYRDTAEVAEELVVGTGAARRVFDLRLTPLSDRRGRQSGQLIVWRDITEHKRVGAALQRRVEQLAALKQIADIAIRMDDLTAALQHMSEIATALFAAKLTLIFIPIRHASEQPVLVGFERDIGQLDSASLDAILTSMPLSDLALPRGQSLILSALDALPLPPPIRAFVTTYQVQSMMHIPLTIRDTVVGVMAVAADQAGRVFGADEASLAETIAGDISAAIDNNRLYRRALAGRERLTALYQAAQAISRASLDPEQVYAEIHRAAGRLMPADALVIATYDVANQEVDYVYLFDKDGRWPAGRSRLADSFAGYLLGRDASVRIDDFSTFQQTHFAFELFGDEPDTQSGLAALLRGSEQVLGMLFVQSYSRGAYTDEDEETLKLLAAHAAIALENARRYEQARELAASEERTRLARELHDSVTQTLYAASLLTEALPVVWQRSPAEGARNLAKLRLLVRGALAEMRTLLFELRPAALTAADLGTLLKQLGDVLTGHTRIPVELTVEGQASIPPDVKIALYRIAQEAFNNVAKHAGAARVGVTFQAQAGALFLSVCDDGRGFDLAAVPAERMGLRIMAERAAGIGAELRIESTPRRGTTVSVSWPEPGVSG
ncbi:MAG: GAF domain-containing protein [Kouleothrix sp.]|nr:GAF domain-containing protein [Kouleothrix sp.]